MSSLWMEITIIDRNLLEKYSSIGKLQRIILCIYRFIENSENKTNKRTGVLTPCELEALMRTIIRFTQFSEFGAEINDLQQRGSLSPQRKFLPSNPFLGDQGLLRIGGWLAHSELLENQKHPIALPAKHHITRLNIRKEHLRLHHAGPQATLYFIRKIYWSLNGCNVTRQIIHNCIACFRLKPRGIEYIIWDLPPERVSHSPIFKRRCRLEVCRKIRFDFRSDIRHGRMSIDGFLTFDRRSM